MDPYKVWVYKSTVDPILQLLALLVLYIVQMPALPNDDGSLDTNRSKAQVHAKRNGESL